MTVQEKAIKFNCGIVIPMRKNFFFSIANVNDMCFNAFRYLKICVSYHYGIACPPFLYFLRDGKSKTWKNLRGESFRIFI